MNVWQGFCHLELGWSSFLELVATGGTQVA